MILVAPLALLFPIALNPPPARLEPVTSPPCVVAGSFSSEFAHPVFSCPDVRRLGPGPAGLTPLSPGMEASAGPATFSSVPRDNSNPSAKISAVRPRSVHVSPPFNHRLLSRPVLQDHSCREGSHGGGKLIQRRGIVSRVLG